DLRNGSRRASSSVADRSVVLIGSPCMRGVYVACNSDARVASMTCEVMNAVIGCSNGTFEQTERMTERIEHHPNVRLGLVVGESGAAFDRPLDTGREVVACDVEVHHHLLRVRGRGPYRFDVLLLVREREPRRREIAGRVPHAHPAG